MTPPPTAPEPDGDASQGGVTLLAALNAILSHVDRIPVADYEDLDGERLAPLVADTCEILASAAEVAGDLLDHYEQLAESRASFTDLRLPSWPPGTLIGEVERAMDEDAGIRRIQNLAFIARMGLQARVTALGNLGAEPAKWEVIGAAGSALREVLKALGALAVAICAQEGLPEPTTFYVTELSRSLAVRRAYRIFYADVDPQHEPQGIEIGRRLRRAASAIAKLTGRPIYPSLRVHDRYSLRAIQRRLAAFLGSAGDDVRAREAAGLRLFHDLASMVGLMLSVNDRAELRAHDTRTLAEVVPALEFEGAAVAPALGALRTLYGRDLELDAMLSGAEPPTAAQLIAKVRQLQLQLAPRHASVRAPRLPSALPEGGDFL